MRRLKSLIVLSLMTLSSVISYAQKNKKVEPIRSDVLKMLESRDYTIHATALPIGFAEYFDSQFFYLKIRGPYAETFLPYYTGNSEKPLDGGYGMGLDFTALIENYTANYDRKGTLVIHFDGKLANETGQYIISIFPDGSSNFSISFNRFPQIEYIGRVVTSKAADLAYDKAHMSKSEIAKEKKKLEKEKSKFKEFNTATIDSIFANKYNIEINKVKSPHLEEEREAMEGCYLKFEADTCACTLPIVVDTKNPDVQDGRLITKSNPFELTVSNMTKVRTKDKNLEINFEYRASSNILRFKLIISPEEDVTMTLQPMFGDPTVFKGKIVK